MVCHSGVFFFQAADGIRDDLVTGVQTCALPIWLYPLQITVDPSSWYNYTHYSQIGWIFDNELSSDPSGASIVYDEANYTWSIKVREECLNNGTYVFKPFIHSRVSSEYDVRASEVLAITFTSANRSEEHTSELQSPDH